MLQPNTIKKPSDKVDSYAETEAQPRLSKKRKRTDPDSKKKHTARLSTTNKIEKMRGPNTKKIILSGICQKHHQKIDRVSTPDLLNRHQTEGWGKHENKLIGQGRLNRVYCEWGEVLIKCSSEIKPEKTEKEYQTQLFDKIINQLALQHLHNCSEEIDSKIHRSFKNHENYELIEFVLPTIKFPKPYGIFNSNGYGEIIACESLEPSGSEKAMNLIEMIQLSPGGHIENDKQIVIAFQLLLCLFKMKSAGIVHGDIKLENITLNMEDNHIWPLAMIDLGYCKAFQNQEGSNFKKVMESYCENKDLTDHIIESSGLLDFFHSINGTSRYIAPETLRKCQKKKYNTEIDLNKSDIWCVGIVLYILQFKTFPFEKQAQYHTVEMKPLHKDILEESEYGKLILKMLNQSETERPDVVELINDLLKIPALKSAIPFKDKIGNLLGNQTHQKNQNSCHQQQSAHISKA